jgi:nucleotide-binding universal stress UspA family protein
MTIICGTDFSAAAEAACGVAAELAAHHRERLLIVHTVALLPMASPAGVPIAASAYDDIVAAAKTSIDALVRKLAGTGAEIVTSVEVGEPDEVLLRLAAHQNARLIVIGSVGRRGGRWLLGSTADRLASRSAFPLLVTRPGFPAHGWLREGKALRVIVASDLGPATDPAVKWAAHLTEHGPCQYVVAHLSWPPAEYDRLALDGPMQLDRTHPIVEELVQRDLSSAARSLRGEGETKVMVESTMGRTADALMYVASREEADLLVVGRSLDDERQWWETSTSRNIVRKAPMSVVVVPQVEDEPEIAAPRIRRVLAATDLSRRGNAAVAYALALAPSDASVRIIHILDSEDPQEAQRCRRAVDDLVRSVAPDPGIAVEIEIIRGDNPGRRISGEGERFDADLICIGTRGRYGISRVLFGSVSQEVQLRSDRPVLLVQEAPRQDRS